MVLKFSSKTPIVLKGNDYDETITGTTAKENIYGWGGDDRIDGNGGQDYVWGGDGDDDITGHMGDKLNGGAGYDAIRLDLSKEKYSLNLTLTGKLYEYTEIAPGTTMRSFEYIFLKMGSGTNVIDLRGARTKMISFDGAAGTDTVKADFQTGNIWLINVETIELDFSKSGKRFLEIGGHAAVSIHEIGVNYVDLRNYKTLRLNLADLDDEATGTGASDIIKGNGGNDIIHGLGGKDFLYGGAGNDTLYGQTGATLNGGAGNDVIYGVSGTTMVGGSGKDTAVLDFSNIKTDYNFSVTRTADGIIRLDKTTTLQGFENLELIFGVGNNIVRLNNLQMPKIDGFSTNVRGTFGTDTLIIDATTGGNYSFRYFHKAVVDLSKSQSSVTMERSDHNSTTLTNKLMTADFFDPIIMEITGSRYDDTLSAGGKEDTIKGGGGNDVLMGGRGSDALYGGAGNDILIGGHNSDYLVGGSGSDRFTYNSVGESQMPAEFYLDMIADFERGKDKIDLSPIDVSSGKSGDQSFTFKGKAPFSGARGEVHYYTVATGVVVEADINGDGNDDMAIYIAGLKVLTASDFIL